MTQASNQTVSSGLSIKEILQRVYNAGYLYGNPFGALNFYPFINDDEYAMSLINSHIVSLLERLKDDLYKRRDTFPMWDGRDERLFQVLISVIDEMIREVKGEQIE